MTPAGKKLDDFLGSSIDDLKARQMSPALKRPMELVAFRGRLERAQKLEVGLGETGARFDAVLDAIDEQHGQIRDYVDHQEGYSAQLAETIRRMVGDGSNNPPESGDGRKADGAGDDKK